MKNNDLLKLTVSSILVAYAIAIDYLMKLSPFLNQLNGGHVSIACLLLVIIGFLHGKLYGFCGAIVFAILNWLFDGAVSNPWSILLDYLIAFGAFGIAGFFKNVFEKKKYVTFVLVLFVASTIRFASSTLSGIVAYDTPLWGSIVYNAPYIYVSFIISAIIGCLIIPTLSKLQNGKKSN